jgi:hypothetical protein
VHSTLENETDPTAARSHLNLLLDSIWLNDHVPAASESSSIVKTTRNCIGDLLVLRHGQWDAAGECINCDHIGPAYSHCQRCDPQSFLFVNSGLSLDDIVIDPQRIGAVAHLLHTTLQDETNPAASRSHFHLLLDSFLAAQR